VEFEPSSLGVDEEAVVQIDPEAGIGLSAVAAMVRSLLGADFVTIFAVRGHDVGVPVVCNPNVPLPPFVLDGNLLSLAAAMAPGFTDGMSLPSGLVIALPARPIAAALVPCREGGVLVGGLLVLWAEGTTVPVSLGPPVQAVIPFLPRLLRESEAHAGKLRTRERFEDLLASVPLGLVFLDARSQEALVNGVAARMLRCDSGFICPNKVAAAMQAVRARSSMTSPGDLSVATLARPDAMTPETWHVDGRVFTINSHPILGQYRYGRVWIFEDVTVAHETRRQLEEFADQLRTARDEAQAANRAKSSFLATMSHELRTPLNAVLGYTEMIRDQHLGPVGRPEYIEYASYAHEGGEHLLSLINDILDLSRIEAGRSELQPDNIDVIRLVRSCVQLTRRRAHEKGIRVEVDVDHKARQFVADPRAVKQVLVNLLSNAIKYTWDNGHVALTASQRTDGDIQFEIADTGIGMTSAEVDIALTTFGRIDSDLAVREGGTGLGLPLAKSLVEHQGGRLEITSKPGQGTTVLVIFPQAPAGWEKVRFGHSLVTAGDAASAP
jgi:signal transduction histidine kinase